MSGFHPSSGLVQNQYGDKCCALNHLCPRCRQFTNTSQLLQVWLRDYHLVEQYREFDKESRVAVVPNRRRDQSRAQPIGIERELAKETHREIKELHSLHQPETFLLFRHVRGLMRSWMKYHCHLCAIICDHIKSFPYDPESPVTMHVELGIKIPGLYCSVDIGGNSTGRVDKLHLGTDVKNYLADALPFYSEPEQSTVLCLSTNSKSHKALANYWLKGCRENHAHCHEMSTTSFGPSRLLHIGKADTGPPKVKIIETDTLNVAYSTLSYRWGSSENCLLLTTKTKSDFKIDIPFSSMPRTIQDAIDTTLAIGLAYIWVDCLCILQDSADDFVKETSQMCAIYEHATLTIMAERATNMNESFMGERYPQAWMKCRILEKNGLYLYLGRMPRQYSSQTGNLESRAWCFQERLSSPRMLKFEQSGMSWECRFGSATEEARDGHETYYQPVQRDDSPVGNNVFGIPIEIGAWKLREALHEKDKAALAIFNSDINVSSSLSSIKLHQLWYNILEVYQRGQLSHAEDKLVAMAGIANKIRASICSEYLAGLWQASILQDLMWRVDLTAKPRTNRPRIWRAPTWSWASVDHQLHPSFFQFYGQKDSGTTMCKLEAYEIVAKSKVDRHKLGALTKATLILLGQLQKFPASCISYENGLSCGKLRLGHQEIGEIWLDDRLPLCEDFFLLPIFHCVTDDQYRQEHEIAGIALQRCTGHTERFRRCGMFQIDWWSMKEPYSSNSDIHDRAVAASMVFKDNSADEEITII